EQAVSLSIPGWEHQWRRWGTRTHAEAFAAKSWPLGSLSHRTLCYSVQFMRKVPDDQSHLRPACCPRRKAALQTRNPLRLARFSRVRRPSLWHERLDHDGHRRRGLYRGRLAESPHVLALAPLQRIESSRLRR